MAVVEFITKDDLAAFKAELLGELKMLFGPTAPVAKQWLKSREVRAILHISAGTLQNLRVSGVLRYTRVGGTLFYKAADIDRLFEANNAGAHARK